MQKSRCHLCIMRKSRCRLGALSVVRSPLDIGIADVMQAQRSMLRGFRWKKLLSRTRSSLEHHAPHSLGAAGRKFAVSQDDALEEFLRRACLSRRHTQGTRRERPASSNILSMCSRFEREVSRCGSSRSTVWRAKETRDSSGKSRNTRTQAGHGRSRQPSHGRVLSLRIDSPGERGW